MATVYIPTMLRDLTGGKGELEISGMTVREIIDNLDLSYPGIRERFMVGNQLRPNISVAVDGEISPLGALERVEPSSEVHFVAAIRGGSTGDLPC
jgi:molybdopterin converting factor small subunit